ncbi:MAG: polysaccharide deacetylase family protein [Ruminococcus sp.]|nr:polysaccharide deacetylase family protein [Ruminococcus sp.]
MKKRPDKLMRAIACVLVLLIFGTALLAARLFGMRSREKEKVPAAEQTAAAIKEGICIPVIMYHSVYPETGTSEHIITPSQLESDLVYLKDNGFTPIFCSDVIAYRKNSAKLPDKPVILTFDDGCLNFRTNALPLMKKYDMCCTLSVVGRFAEYASEAAEPSPAYSYLSINDLKTVMSSGRVELANHSYDMHALGDRRGSTQMASESFEVYRRALFNDVFAAQRLFRDELDREPAVYTYPYGLTCAAEPMLLEMCGFDLLLGCEEKLNYVTVGDELITLGRFNRSPNYSTEEFFDKVLKGYGV